MADRSVTINFNNETDRTLRRVHVKLEHGAWSDNGLPPETIDPHSTGSFCSESDGFMTGTQGEATYSIDSAGLVIVKWDNPFVGHNSYSSSTPKYYEVYTTGGSGDNSTINYTLLVQ